MTDSLQPDQGATRAGRGTDTWRLTNLVQALDEPESSLRERAAHRLGFEPGELRGFRIAKRWTPAAVARTCALCVRWTWWWIRGPSAHG